MDKRLEKIKQELGILDDFHSLFEGVDKIKKYFMGNDGNQGVDSITWRGDQIDSRFDFIRYGTPGPNTRTTNGWKEFIVQTARSDDTFYCAIKDKYMIFTDENTTEIMNAIGQEMYEY